METHLKVLLLDASSGYYKMERFRLGDFFGPVDLGLHLSGRYGSLNIGTGLLAGSIIPGSNRLVFTGYSPCWGGFYISSMGGAGLVFDNLGINMLSIMGKSPSPSVLCLNRSHGEEIEVRMVPVDMNGIWSGGRGGFYSMIDHVYGTFSGDYADSPRVLAVGQASLSTDFGAIGSVHLTEGRLSNVDTWAGRGGLGTKMLREHGICAVIYGGTFIDEDFRDRTVADSWFQDRYDKKLAAKDLEATTKYRYDEKFSTGGTFGVNFASLAGRMMAFNYKSIYMDESERIDIHEKFIVGHYLKQFNEETIAPRRQKTCGEPCAAVCKKMAGEFKKDYEPYQTMGPLCGIFDQRAAEMINHRADTYGFDAISAGGVVSWLMECLHEGLLSEADLGVEGKPVFSHKEFSVETDSMTNAKIGTGILDSIINGRGVLNLDEGARKLARRLAREKDRRILDSFVFNSNARRGWMVPNQYWTPGVLSPMPIAGKYYMNYGAEFIPPRELGRKNAERLRKELVMDNLGLCRFHRGWAEEMLPEIVSKLFGMKDGFSACTDMTASRINSRNSSVFWESERNFDYVHSFLKRRRTVDNDGSPELASWIDAFEKDKKEAALNFWYEVHKGTHESLREF
ncbi:MAG: aldehyde ferredoxin oxidoreductase [Spirochaetes bacterium]|jgi:glyceraldehyde-3-phosphate dehydrogenase (ferredoxin)|nr:aldehyde ferredoxin oxidoreductase [Spirochaetota bacterium]